MDPKEPEKSKNAGDASLQSARPLLPPSQDSDQEAKLKIAATPPMVGGTTGEHAAAVDAVEQDTPAGTSDVPGQEVHGGPQEVGAHVAPTPDDSPAPIESSDNVVDAYQGSSDDVALDWPPNHAAQMTNASALSDDPFVEPDDFSSDLYTSPSNDDDADLSSQPGSTSPDSVHPEAEAVTFETSASADPAESQSSDDAIAPPAAAAYSPAAWTSPGDEPMAPDPAFEAAIAAADAGDPSPPGFFVEQPDHRQSQRGARSSPSVDASPPEGVYTSIAEGPFIEHPPSLRGSSAAGDKRRIEFESSTANVQKNSVLAVLAMESALLKLIDKAGEQDRHDAHLLEANRRAVWGK